MHLIELALHNVGPYRGKTSLRLATEPGQPIVLIGGMNGCGKTTLLDALQLALYGNRAQLSNRSGQAYEDYLASLVSRGVPLSDGASVGLTFTVVVEGQTRHYEVRRTWAAAGKRVRESLDVFVDGKWDRVLSKSWADHVEDLLPLEIAGLFFFDGEKIEALADPDRAALVIQSAVHSLLGASTVEQLRSDLAALKRRQVPESGDAALEQELADLEELRRERQEKLAEVRARISTVSDDLDRARESVRLAEDAFAAEGGDVFESRLELEKSRATCAAKLASVSSQLVGLAEGMLPLALLGDALGQMATEAAAQQELTTLRAAVSVLGERDQWIIDMVPASARSKLSDALGQDRASRLASLDSALDLDLRPDQFVQIEATPGEVSRDLETGRLLLAEREVLAEDLASLDAQLGQVPDESRIRERVVAREASRSQLSRVEGQVQILREDESGLVSELEALAVKHARAEARRIEAGVANDDKRRILEHADRVRESLDEFRSKLIERNIGRIEVATLDSFQKLMRKSDLVADLRIDPKTYSLTLTTSSGEALSPGRLSAGERQLLAVALLWGLARVAGNRLPTVIDTPLGRLDSAHRRHLVERYFPYASSQVLLLSTDEEIDAELLAELAPSVHASYVLEHDADSDQTVIRDGYWWKVGSTDVA